MNNLTQNIGLNLGKNHQTIDTISKVKLCFVAILFNICKESK